MIALFVHGIPVQQGSMVPGRVVYVNGKPRSTMHSHNPVELKRWRTLIADTIRRTGHEQIGPYVEAHLSFYLPKPKTTKYPEYPAGTPDLDKLVRAAFDAITESGIVEDDARIVRAIVEEEWATEEQPGLALTIRPR